MYTNIKGTIRKISDKGYGFFKATNQSEPYITKDIFFHVSNIKQIDDGEMNWDDLKEGMTIVAGAVSVTNKGYEALEITVPVVSKTKKNHKF